MNEWGSLRHAAGAAGILAIYSRGLADKGQATAADEIMTFAERQVQFQFSMIQSINFDLL